jgi:RHH-type proline utilization regulon transcriptional repressor/proline dehydrogenase/delta 1-pyrroline-5-carboxylate dehydrogenase
LCISPWNFPLAIFLGQVSAALVAGNTVIAKPAEQSPLMAAAATKVLLEAGLPAGTIGLVLGDGSIGARLVKAAAISGVCFTGSSGTAKLIHQSLATRPGPIVPLIAETGGINVLIADSSAHPEQLTLDVIQSAFNSAGQRCSALRLLLIQKEIAPKVLRLLQGAIATLVVSDPASLSTDVGPVIDASALTALNRHLERLEAEATLIGRAEMNANLNDGFFVAPCAYEIPSIDWLKDEVFGPILHVVLYESAALSSVLETVNAMGYGLTLGIHSRIESTARLIAAKLRVGNVYVNRNMIGATVGTQPFGGENLSGTGPKAGGPNYLMRFFSERTLTINTAAVGGDPLLLNRRCRQV